VEPLAGPGADRRAEPPASVAAGAENEVSLQRARARALQLIRSFFGARDHLEVDTPLLSASLIPESPIEAFATRYLGEAPEGAAGPGTLYLVPSPELWMKRLILGGSGSIFQLCRCFRNAERLGALHHPEFTMLEWYTLGADYRRAMGTAEELLGFLREGLQIDPVLHLRSGELDCRAPFRRLSMEEAFHDKLGLPLAELGGREQLAAAARRRGLTVTGQDSWADLFHKLFLAFVEPELPADRPLLLYDYPAAVPTLARRRPGTPWAERWELYLGTVEVANCYTEETDPAALQAFFDSEERHKRRAAVPYPADRELLELMRGGFPLTAGTALGVDRLLMVLLGALSVQQVLPFSSEQLRVRGGSGRRP
jgi:lysyl-tRNA synthetase class 2